ncbi:MAG: alpha/beta hydrolase-fold protein [Acidobacteriota bacterium]
MARSAVFGWLALGLLACQPETPSGAERSSGITPLDHLPALRGDYFAFDSRAVGRGFHVYVRFPEGYDPQGEIDYPVVYLLDGDSLFPILAPQHLFLTYDDGLPEAIVVGIAYGSFEAPINRRGFDYSPAAAEGEPDRGGAPAFHDFLANELVPTIESRYRADPARRILFGQSRGGGFVLYSAFVAPDLFWGRIASNPAFEPGRELYFATEPTARPIASRDDLSLIVTSGSRDRPAFRQAALDWFEAWRTVEDPPWAIELMTLSGGTHAADSSRSYRSGLRWLFGWQPEAGPPDG